MGGVRVPNLSRESSYDPRSDGATLRSPSGHVFRVERARGPVWYAKYRLPDGRQVQKKIGPAWTRTRTSAGWVLHEAAQPRLGCGGAARRRAARNDPGARADRRDVGRCDSRMAPLRRARSPAASRRRSLATRRSCAPSCCRRSARSLLEAVTPRDDRAVGRWGRSSRVSTRVKALVLMHGIFQRARKVCGLPTNPVADVEKPPLSRSDDIEVFSPEEVWALVRAAAVRAGRRALPDRGVHRARVAASCLALRWRDVDFAGIDDPRASAATPRVT